jgi:hypothetical protein
MQLVDQQEENIELAHSAQAPRHLSQPAIKFSAGVSWQLEHRNQLAHPSRCDPNPMKGRHISTFQPVEASRKVVQPRFQQFDDAVDDRHGGRRKSGHDVDWKRAIIVALCG